MKLPKALRAALPVLLLIAAAAPGARAQGVVLDAKGQVLPARRVRALLVFQERGVLAHTANAPNRQDLLVEVELAEPAPQGAVWVLSCIAEGASARPRSAEPLDEVSAFWRGAAVAAPGKAWPAGAGGAELKFGKPMDAAGLRGFLADRKMSGEYPLPERKGRDKWAYFTAEVPAGARRIGPAQITCYTLAARYPGALGAKRGEEKSWELAPTELMLLHSHFINVADNPWGLAALGFKEHYRDPGTLQKGRPLWFAPPPEKPGEARAPGRIRGEAGQMPATAKFVESLGAAKNLFLTAVSGEARSAERSDLDIKIYSHYPSAVESTGTWSSFLWLGASLLALVLLARLLLKRKGFAQ